MLIATNEEHTLKLSGMRRSVVVRNESARSNTERRLSFSGLIASNNRVNQIVRFMYFLNAAIILAGLAYITSTQQNGNYRCGTISVLFDEEIWENAIVILPDGGTEERVLIYSSFNGIYKGEYL